MTELNARLDHGVPLTVVDGIEVADTDAADATMAEAKARIEALEAERDEARRERDELIAWFDGLTPAEMHDSIKTQLDRSQTSEARCKRLEEALRPFAALYVESMRDYPDGTAKHDRPDDRQAWGFNNANLMWGDFRRARLAIQEGAP